jgi:NTP pyrophosphatase (non-canonical NTP hydrolase)
MEIVNLIDKLEKVSEQYANKFSIQRDNDWFVFKVQEELGEAVQKYLMLSNRARQKGKTPEEIREEFEAEVSDVLCHVLLLVKHMDIDIERVIEKKWFSYLR